MIDSDLYTHGLTFLLSEKISSLDKNKFGLIETIVNSNRKLDILNGKKGIKYVASTTNPRSVTSNIISKNIEESSSIVKNKINDIIKKYVWDYIIIDTQAGPEDITKAMVNISDTVVIISESDAISQFTNLNLLGELYEYLPQNRTYKVINKLQYEQLEYKKIIDDLLSQLAYLPPIPFDFNVIKAFLIGEIPIDFERPSSYLYSVIKFIQYLFPEAEVKLNKYLHSISKKLLAPLEEIKNNYQINIEKLNDERALIDEKIRSIKSSLSYVQLIKETFPMLAVLFVLFFYIFKDIFNLSENILFFGATYIIFIYILFRWRSSKKEFATEEEIRELNNMKEDINRQLTMQHNELSNIKTLITERTYELQVQKK